MSGGSLALALAVACLCSLGSAGSSYVHPAGNFRVSWLINISSQSIAFTVSGNTTGYVSIGFSGNGSMIGADIITGWITSSGHAIVLDQYASARAQPMNDKVLGSGGKNDLGNISGWQSAAGWTTITFQRPLSTTDKWDAKIRNSTQYLIFAMGTADGSSTATDSSTINIYSNHFFSGAVALNFFNSSAAVTQPATQPSTGLDPGLMVLICTAIVTFIYACIHWGKIFSKRKEPPVARPSITSISAPLTAFDSMRLQYTVGQASAADAKPLPSRATMFLQGMATLRVPYIDASLAWVLMIFLYTLGNFIAMMVPLNGMDMATNFGYLSGANACLLLIPATRNSLLSFLFGIPFDRHVSLHRILALFAVFLVALHTFLFWDKWQKDPNASISLTWTNRKYLYGFIGFLGGLMLVLTSLPWVRRNHFNCFLYNHYFWALIFYIFAMMHTPVRFLPKLVIVCILYGLDKLIRAIYGTLPMRANAVKISSGDMVTLSFPKNKIAQWLNLYSVSQYVFVNFPQLSYFEWHPFSLSSGPNESQCEISVRSLGDHTKKILALATDKKLHDSTIWMRVDGPYGNYGVNYNRYPVKIFFAGGIGITPIVSILRAIYGVGRDGAQAAWLENFPISPLPLDSTPQLGHSPSQRSGHSQGSQQLDDSPVFVPLDLNEMEDLAVKRRSHLIQRYVPSVMFETFPAKEMQDIYVMWAISKEEHYQWFADIFDKIRLLEHDFSLPRLHLLVYLSDRSNAPETLQSPIIKGSLRSELRDTLSEIVLQHRDVSMSVYACGPTGMMEDCWDCISELQRGGNNIHFHKEEFEF